MKKILVAALTALAVTAAVPAFAADMPVKGKKAVVATPSPWDVAFGTALTTDYIFRGISQSARRPAVQGYFEGRYTVNDMVQLYAGVWGSSLWTGLANAEFDIYGGARFTVGNFGLDVGYLYYYYPEAVLPNSLAGLIQGKSNVNFGEVYAKPSYKFNDWLTIGGQVMGGGDFGNTGMSAWYYAGNVAVTLPSLLPYSIATTISAEIGRQTYSGGYKALPGVFVPNVAGGIADYTTWNVGVAFAYKAMTLDLRYYDTNIDITSNPTQCATGTTFTSDACKSAFVATLKFDTTFSSLK
ncbi:MAG: TorF family putative porin [Pseudolabrys sp.]|nr:TorF family putative porin [Pseudolabrys sp.]